MNIVAIATGGWRWRDCNRDLRWFGHTAACSFLR